MPKHLYYVILYLPVGDPMKAFPCEEGVFSDKKKAEEDLDQWRRWMRSPEIDNYMLVEIMLTAEEAEAILRQEGNPIP